MPEATQPPRRSNSRSGRSHPSFSDLRLAPLSVPAQPHYHHSTSKSSSSPPRTPGGTHISTTQAYKYNHSSYLAGRSAPSTPGILSRSSSRRRLYGGLSRKTPSAEDEDTENVHPDYFAYEAVRVAPHGGVPDTSSGVLGHKPKSKSESGLQHAQQGKRAGKLAPSSANQSKRRSHHGAANTIGPENEDTWLSHATSFTTTLLAEGKGQSWISSHSSVSNLHSYSHPTYYPNHDSDSEQEEHDLEHAPRLASEILIASPLRSPALLSAAPGGGWGSRFGSRAQSRSTSRRGSRAAPLTRPFSGPGTPHPLSSRPGTSSGPPGPDFVDPAARAEMQASLTLFAQQQGGGGGGEGYFDSLHGYKVLPGGENDEEEVARLARTPGFGLGGFGIIDRLVGLGTFRLEEGRGSDVEVEEEEGREKEGRKKRGVWNGAMAVGRGGGKAKEVQNQPQAQAEGGGGWSDAAWLLSVASKVLL